MKIFGFEIGSSKNELKPKKATKKREINATTGYPGAAYYVSFDGEKNAGEIGPIIKYDIDFKSLSFRSWQAYLESEIARTVLNRFLIWVVDKGLKLQCSPEQLILKNNNIKLDVEAFNSNVESRFNTWTKSTRSSHNNMVPFNELSKQAFKNAKIGGDSLVVLRVKDGHPTVQIYDTAHLSTLILKPKNKNNKIVNGVEIDKNGKHIGYHLNSGNYGSTIYIPAWSSSTGLRTAFLVYGNKYRLDEHRGLPIISTSLETMKKIERYKEAAVGSAEERQKIAFSIEHNQFSDGENPLGDIAAIISGTGDDNVSVPEDENGQKLANTVTATTGKQAINMPIGSQLKALESKNELFFKEFYQTNADIICASVGIPPNVAFSLYNDSFSASRAATKDWEHTLDVERDDFATQYYKIVYKFWFHVQVLGGHIDAPGYLEAFNKDDFMVIDAYLNCRFTGPGFPHIDPLKEVNAVRSKLGSKFKDAPLITLEQATETLFGGDSKSNIEQAAKELEDVIELGFSGEDKSTIDSLE